MEPSLKCGVAGVGYLGKHHARLYHSLEGANLVGIFEPSDDAANAVCAEYGCTRFSSIEELGIACDAVSVVCPTDRHAEVSLTLVEQGCICLLKTFVRFFGGGRVDSDSSKSHKCHGSSWPY